MWCSPRRADAGADLKRSLPAGPDRAGKASEEIRGAHAPRTGARRARGSPCTRRRAAPPRQLLRRPTLGGREPPAPELREREGKPDPRCPRPARLEAASAPSFVCCLGRDPLPFPRSLPPPDGARGAADPAPSQLPRSPRGGQGPPPAPLVAPGAERPRRPTQPARGRRGGGTGGSEVSEAGAEEGRLRAARPGGRGWGGPRAPLSRSRRLPACPAARQARGLRLLQRRRRWVCRARRAEARGLRGPGALPSARRRLELPHRTPHPRRARSAPGPAGPGAGAGAASAGCALPGPGGRGPGSLHSLLPPGGLPAPRPGPRARPAGKSGAELAPCGGRPGALDARLRPSRRSSLGCTLSPGARDPEKFRPSRLRAGDGRGSAGSARRAPRERIRAPPPPPRPAPAPPPRPRPPRSLLPPREPATPAQGSSQRWDRDLRTCPAARADATSPSASGRSGLGP